MPDLRLIHGGIHARADERALPCTHCHGSGGPCCGELGHREAQRWETEKAAYREQVRGMADAQLSEAAVWAAIEALRPLASRQAWFARMMLEVITERAGWESVGAADGQG